MTINLALIGNKSVKKKAMPVDSKSTNVILDTFLAVSFNCRAVMRLICYTQTEIFYRTKL